MVVSCMPIKILVSWSWALICWWLCNYISQCDKDLCDIVSHLRGPDAAIDKKLSLKYQIMAALMHECTLYMLPIIHGLPWIYAYKYIITYMNNDYWSRVKGDAMHQRVSIRSSKLHSAFSKFPSIALFARLFYLGFAYATLVCDNNIVRSFNAIALTTFLMIQFLQLWKWYHQWALALVIKQCPPLTSAKIVFS